MHQVICHRLFAVNASSLHLFSKVGRDFAAHLIVRILLVQVFFFFQQSQCKWGICEGSSLTGDFGHVHWLESRFVISLTWRNMQVENESKLKMEKQTVPPSNKHLLSWPVQTVVFLFVRAEHVIAHARRTVDVEYFFAGFTFCKSFFCFAAGDCVFKMTPSGLFASFEGKFSPQRFKKKNKHVVCVSHSFQVAINS